MQDGYRELFLSEAQEYLNNISNCLVKIEEDPSDLESLNEVFRCIHTLKGMSATMGYEKLAGLSHQMEDLLDELRSQKKKLTLEISDALFASVDILERLVEDIRLSRESKVDIAPCLEDLKRLLTADQPAEGVMPKEKKPERAALPELEEQALEFSDPDIKKIKEAKSRGLNSFKIRVTLVRDCVMKEARAFLVISNLKRRGEIIKAVPQVEDIKEGRFELAFTLVLVSKESREIIANDLLNISDIEKAIVEVVDVAGKTAAAAPQGAPSYIKKIQSMRIPVERLDKIMNLMGELTIAKIRLLQIMQSFKLEPLEEVGFTIDHLTSALQDEIIQTRLLPVAYILDAFPRVVRDLSKKQNKEVDLEMTGSEIELDRVALDEIGDLLVHLVRNAIDHGIESPEERKAKGKNLHGKLAIKVSRQKGQIFIEVSDDGKGVDFSAVRKKALEKGLISGEEAAALDEKRVLDLISLPGFSTARVVSDISGRGVGLDVVKSKIESLGGRLDFETKPEVGSRFILTLPLTLAIIKAMLVRVEGEILAVPLMNIRETIKINEVELKFLQSFEVIRVRDEVIPVIRLNRELDIPVFVSSEQYSDDRLSVVIIEYGKKALGLVVSQVLGEQDIVVKPLGSFVKRTKGIAGATILGDGRVALILDTMSLR